MAPLYGKRSWRVASLLTFAACAIAGLAVESCRARERGDGARATPIERPSFVVVLLDDLDADLGSPEVMPRTRRLIAEQGLELTRHFVSTPLCCPSRITLLTGRYVHNHGVYRNRGALGGFHRVRELGVEQGTLAVALQRRGYRTALVGKYVNEYFGPYVPPGWSRWVAADTSAYNGFRYVLTVDGVGEKHVKKESDYVTDVLAGHAEAFLAEQQAGTPFFLYFAPLAPHPPATPAPRHKTMFADRRVPRTPAFNEADVADKPPTRQLSPLGAEDVASLDAHYRDRLRALQAVDEAVERLYGALERRGLLATTYVMVTSDNGFHLGQHRLPFGKGTAYEEDVHVPLYVRGPGVRVDEKDARLTTSADLPTTIADLAGAQLANGDGRSLRPLLESKKRAPWRELVLVENFAAGDDEGSRGEAAEAESPPQAPTPLFSGLRGERMKYVELDGGKHAELYDLDDDPHELDNLAACLTPESRRQLADLLHAMAACKGEECRTIEARDFPRLKMARGCSPPR